MPEIFEDNFKSLSENKLEFVHRLSQDIELAKCLLSDSQDFKKYTPTDEDLDDLIWKNIYPCQYTVGTLQEVKSFITMRFKYLKSHSSVYKTGYITFYIFCHKDIVKTDYGILRYDFMLQRVNQLMFNTRNLSWIGKMEFDSMSDILTGNTGDFVGVEITYRNTELM